MTNQLSPVLYIPHGGGPLPLLGDEGHQEMISFLQNIPSTIARPSAILVISAHWEKEEVTITSAQHPKLLYDYSGFPSEAYEVTYPAPGMSSLAKKIQDLLQDKGINANLDEKRGFDHGMFVPLKLMYPEANIPCVQLSLVKGLDPTTHIQIGKALQSLRNENILILGSGLSFHNMKAFFSSTPDSIDEENEAFEQWLIDTCTNDGLKTAEREQKLIQWSDAPSARYAHPREEHLIPLHVCYGASEKPAKLVFDGKVIGKKASGYLW